MLICGAIFHNLKNQVISSHLVKLLAAPDVLSQVIGAAKRSISCLASQLDLFERGILEEQEKANK